MKDSRLIPLFALLAFSVQAAPTSAASGAVTLNAAFQAAMKRSETIGDQTEQIVQAEERYRQAFGSVLPTISGTASYLVQDSPSTLGTTISPSTQPLIKVTLAQPLFRGFREFAGLRQAKSLTRAQEEAKKQAVLQLFTDVTQSYFTILSLETDLKNLQTQITLYLQRIKELQDRVKIGRSRLTEVLTVKSLLGSLYSQVEQIKGQLAASREMYHFLTGLPADTSLEATSLLPAKLEPVENYLGKAGGRPDVLGAEARLVAARENTSVAEGGHWPSADLVGNYYFKRFGATQDVKWDVGVALTIPIFNGGIIQSQVHQAASQEQQGELALTRAKRNAEHEISSFYKNVASDLAAIEEFQKTKDISELNSKEETKEYRLGLVTNLEVLTAISTFHENERALDRARYTAEIDMGKLQAATGTNVVLSGGK